MKMENGDFVCLNDEGKKELGHIFPNSIPVICMLPERATLEGLNQILEVRRIDLSRLTEEQRKMCFDYVAQKRQSNRIEVEAELTKMGFIPLQNKWVSSFGTTQPYKYLPDFDEQEAFEDGMEEEIIEDEDGIPYDEDYYVRGFTSNDGS